LRANGGRSEGFASVSTLSLVNAAGMGIVRRLQDEVAMRTKQDGLPCESAFPWHGAIEEQIAYLLRYATLAPSSHSTQPWRFSVVQNTVELRSDLPSGPRGVDCGRRELDISLGCALENVLIAAERFGFGHEVLYPAEGRTGAPAASVTLLAEGTPSTCRPVELFEAITTLRTNRGRDEGRPVPAVEVALLRECAVDGGVGLFLTDDREIRRKVRELVLFADRQLVSNAAWRRDAAALARAPFVGLLHSSRDDRESRIRVGQSFERVRLVAARRGLSVQPLGQIVELPEVRGALRALLPDPDAYPQHPFSVGYGHRAARPAPRRQAEPVLA
jgi:nitroreductase